MSNIISGVVVRFNNFEYPTGLIRGISCDQARMEGFYWRIPTSSKGVLNGFEYRLLEVGDPKPTLDSLRVVKISDARNDVFYLAVADGADESVWNDLCNECCGETYVMPAVIIPDPVVEETGCLVDGTYCYFSVTRALGAGETYRIAGSANGTAQPAAPPEGFASLAAMESWIEANWTGSAVTIVGTKVTVCKADYKTGSFAITVGRVFESGAGGVLASGSHFHAAATINGTVLTPIDGVADGALTTIDDLANANTQWSSYGKWSVVADKLRLVAEMNVTSATITLTKVA